MKRVFFPKSTYIRIFIALAFLCTVIIAMFSLSLTKQFSKYYLEEINVISEHQLEQTVFDVEFTLNKLKSYGINMYQDPDIMSWVSDNSRNKVADYNAIRALRRYINTEPFISNVYLLNRQTGHILDYQKGISTLGRFHDQALLELIEEKKQGYLHYFYHEAGHASYWGLILPPDISKIDHYGSVVILFDLKIVGEYIQNSGNSDVQIAIMDVDGNSVLGKEIDEWNATIYKQASQEIRSHFQFDYEGEAYFASASSVNSNKWNLFYIISMSGWYEKVNQFSFKIVISSFAMLIAIMIVMFWNSRKYIKPFSTLANNVMQLATGPREERSTDSEYDVIKRGIDNLVHTRDEMMHTMRDHEGLILDDYFRRWILQGKMNFSIREYIEKRTPFLQYKHIQLAVIRIDAYAEFQEKYNFESRKLIKYAIGNIAQEVLMQEGVASRPVDIVGDHLVLLIGCLKEPALDRQYDNQLVHQKLSIVKEQIMRWLKLQVTIAVSEVRNITDDVQLLYENMYELTTFKFVSGEDRIYEEQDLVEYDKLLQPPDDVMLLEQIIYSVRLGQEDVMREHLDKLFLELQHLSYIDCKMQLELIMHTFMRSFHSIKSVQLLQGTAVNLDRFSTLQAYRLWFEEQLVHVLQTIQSNGRSGRKEEYVDEMVEYIQNHLHSAQLNIDEIAEKLSLSPGYVRQLFKEVTDNSLSDYILNKRVENVCTLLINTDWTIAEIAKQSGFQTKSHFFTIFKKSTGLTPNQYRIAHGSEQAERNE
ncbi:helix-turn-helix domain-containing protein [Bacillus sp. FJAT-28004]|uniref:helix-turn-helix domain-containing protein n=1 Tax=Bacillus sp. FJAT-28004 TaxID=1679165 RepID=UPI0006B46E0C|nr:helix-turn-helix domain-containing protein [Bacillus sp. FJAT-28004]